MEILRIKNGTVVDPASGFEGRADVLVRDGRILSILPAREELSGKGERFSPAADTDGGGTELDATGCVVAPGLVDVHTHFRDPGQTHKEDILTGAAAGVRGGYTTLVGMANTMPPVSDTETLSYIIEKGRRTPIRLYSCATVTVGMRGEALVPMEELRAAGAVGFTDDGKPLLNEALVEEAMRRARALDVPLCFHEEDPAYIGTAGIHAGKVAESMGLSGAKREAESTMVRRDIRLLRKTGARIDIQHVSARETVELVRAAKEEERKRGGERLLYAEASPHHFSLIDEDVRRYGTLAKMNPPLRTESDRRAIIEGLKDGTLDIIATDHAPHSREEKSRPFTEAPSGITGLETALSLGITRLVRTGELTLMQLLEKLTLNPARLFRLDAGYLAEGGPADVVIFQPEEKRKVSGFLSKSSNSPFFGETLYGEVKYVLCGGRVVYPPR